LPFNFTLHFLNLLPPDLQIRQLRETRLNFVNNQKSAKK
jgi:hypothetical protein